MDASGYYGTCDMCLRVDVMLWLVPAHGTAAYLCRECKHMLTVFGFDPILLGRELRRFNPDARPHQRRRARGPHVREIPPAPYWRPGTRKEKKT